MPHDDVTGSCVHRVSHFSPSFLELEPHMCFGVSGCIRSIIGAALGSDLVFMWEAWVGALAGFI